MTRMAVPGTTVDHLAHHVFDGADGDGMAAELAGWLAGSGRFFAFAEVYRDKIRKKLRGAADEEARRDVRAELRVAHLLLADRRIELAFEPYGSATGGPDFSVIFRGERSFNLEVTRLRRAPDTAGLGGQLLAKLRQLPPSVPNAVLIAIEADGAEALDIPAAMRTLRARADTNDETFLASRGFGGRRGFYDGYLRLGAVVVSCERAAGDARVALWSNRSARMALPVRAAQASVICLRAG